MPLDDHSKGWFSGSSTYSSDAQKQGDHDFHARRKQAQEAATRRPQRFAPGIFSHQPSNISRPVTGVTYSPGTYVPAIPLSPEEKLRLERLDREEIIGNVIATITIGSIAATGISAFLFPNEVTILVVGTVSTGAVVGSDFVRNSNVRSGAALVTGIFATGLGMWSMHAGHDPEGVAPKFIWGHSGAFFSSAFVAGAALYCRTIRSNIRWFAGVPAAIALLAGTVDGLHDGFIHKEINPFNAGTKAFVDTSHKSSIIYDWMANDLNRDDVGPVVKSVLNVPRIVVSFPYEASAYVGGAVGNACATVFKYTIINGIKFAGHELSKALQNEIAREKTRDNPKHSLTPMGPGG